MSPTEIHKGIFEFVSSGGAMKNSAITNKKRGLPTPPPQSHAAHKQKRHSDVAVSANDLSNAVGAPMPEATSRTSLSAISPTEGFDDNLALSSSRSNKSEKTLVSSNQQGCLASAPKTTATAINTTSSTSTSTVAKATSNDAHVKEHVEDASVTADHKSNNTISSSGNNTFSDNNHFENSNKIANTRNSNHNVCKNSGATSSVPAVLGNSSADSTTTTTNKQSDNDKGVSSSHNDDSNENSNSNSSLNSDNKMSSTIDTTNRRNSATNELGINNNVFLLDKTHSNGNADKYNSNDNNNSNNNNNGHGVVGMGVGVVDSNTIDKEESERRTNGGGVVEMLNVDDDPAVV
eukprot:Awhi_evm1s4735